MRSAKLTLSALLALGIAAALHPTVAHAAAFPVGEYILTGSPGTGIHLSDPGSMSGLIFFDAASNVTYADLTFHDTVTGATYTFDSPGPTSIYNAPPVVVASTITDSADPAASYAFSAGTPSLANGSFILTCDTDCDTSISDTSTNFYEELTGNITPVTPEPGSFVLLGTGALSLVAAARRRISPRL